MTTGIGTVVTLGKHPVPFMMVPGHDLLWPHSNDDFFWHIAAVYSTACSFVNLQHP
ncbi:MAG: hypothetical protein ACJ04P_10910 [Halioglobus sp.]